MFDSAIKEKGFQFVLSAVHFEDRCRNHPTLVWQMPLSLSLPTWLAVIEVMSSIRMGQIDLAPRAARGGTADCSYSVFSGCHQQEKLCQHILLTQEGRTHSSIVYTE